MANGSGSDEATRIVKSIGARRWNAKDATRLLEIMEERGESVAGFARRLGINDKRLRWWRNRLELEAPRPTDRSGEREIEHVHLASVIASDASRVGRWVVGYAAAIVVGPDGVRIEVHDTSAVPTGWIRDLARALLDGDGR